MIGDFRDVRTQILVVVGVLLLFDVGAGVLLMSPAGRASSARSKEYESLRQEKLEKMQAVIPAQGMDQKIVTAREQQIRFNNDRLAERYSAMSEQLARIATGAGVHVSDVKYQDNSEKHGDRTVKETVPPGYDNVTISIQVRGSYEQEMRFINDVERQKMLLLIDGVSFSGMQGDEMSVTVQLSTFRRSAA